MVRIIDNGMRQKQPLIFVLLREYIGINKVLTEAVSRQYYMI